MHNGLITTRAIPTIPFDWENADWMPTPVGQSRIPSPWVGAGSLASIWGIEVINDRKASDGWSLMYSSFDAAAPGPLTNPYFVLYNKYRGLLRMFVYLTTEFVTPSTYLQDGISLISSANTTMFNFMGSEMALCNKTNSYSQIQPAPSDGTAPLASNRWYMTQYEIAYDPNIAGKPFNNYQLNWSLNYHNVTQINLGGTIKGTITGTIGSSATSDNPITGATQTLGTGVIAGIGSRFLTNNTVNATTGENNLGIPNDIFQGLSKGVSNALTGAVSNLPGKIFGLLNSIIGGSSNAAIPVNLNLDAKIELQGNAAQRGSFPSSPISFWVPGTNITSAATGYIPLYDKVLGVCNFTGTPTLKLRYTETIVPVQIIQIGLMGQVFVRKIEFPQNPNYSSYLIFNPEITNIADITIVDQSYVIKGDNTLDYTPGAELGQFVESNPTNLIWVKNSHYPAARPMVQPKNFPENFEIGVRFTIKVTPKDGSPETTLIKTLKIDHTMTGPGVFW